MEDEIVNTICNAINNKRLLELQHKKGDEPFQFAPYLLYRFRGNYGLFGTQRRYHKSGRLEIEIQDLDIESYTRLIEVEHNYEKSFFMEKFQLLGNNELVIICANEDYTSDDE